MEIEFLMILTTMVFLYVYGHDTFVFLGWGFSGFSLEFVHISYYTDWLGRGFLSSVLLPIVFSYYIPWLIGFWVVGPVLSGLFFGISLAHWAVALVFRFLFPLLYGLGLVGLGRFWSPVFFSSVVFLWHNCLHRGFFNLSHGVVISPLSNHLSTFHFLDHA